jgi:hypothetical protein
MPHIHESKHFQKAQLYSSKKPDIKYSLGDKDIYGSQSV